MITCGQLAPSFAGTVGRGLRKGITMGASFEGTSARSPRMQRRARPPVRWGETTERERLRSEAPGLIRGESRAGRDGPQVVGPDVTEGGTVGPCRSVGSAARI